MLSLCLSMKKGPRVPVVRMRASQSRSPQIPRRPPILSPSFWRKGRGHVSPNRPHSKKTKTKPASNFRGHLALGKPKPPQAEGSAAAHLPRCTGGCFLLHFKQKQSDGLQNYTNIKRKEKNGGFFFSVKVCFCPQWSPCPTADALSAWCPRWPPRWPPEFLVSPGSESASVPSALC